MATFMSSRAGSGDQAKYSAVGPVVDVGKYTMTITASAGDVVQLLKVGAGAKLTSLRMWADAASLSFSAGDGDNFEKFMTTAVPILTGWAITGSTTPSILRDINVGSGLGYSFSVADTIDARLAAGGLTGTVIYFVATLVYDSQETI